jgi:hypothetical protein
VRQGGLGEEGDFGGIPLADLEFGFDDGEVVEVAEEIWGK